MPSIASDKNVAYFGRVNEADVTWFTVKVIVAVGATADLGV